jgi:hypothetical protein
MRVDLTAPVRAALGVFGQPAEHTNGDGEVLPVTVILEQSLDAAGLADPWAKRQWTLTVPSSLAAVSGDSFTLGADTWVVDGVVEDDGYLARLAVRRESG